jgi:hypothetical protein
MTVPARYALDRTSLVLAFISSTSPKRCINPAVYTPAPPPAAGSPRTIDFAAISVRFSASIEPTSGLGAPFFTKTEKPTLAISTRVSPSSLPCFFEREQHIS